VEDYRPTFAANLKRLRRDAGMSQEALAEESGLHRTEVSLLETTERDPQLKTIVRLARALGIPASRLLDGI
jgi:transcriptional regulator with XRE-family HTH domain